jgi:exodeoxyribonuclease VII small subunit
MATRSAAPEPANGDPEQSFEESLAALEGVVEQLESGELPLEQALAAFETGISLARRCGSRLDAAELRIKKLEESAKGPSERDFDPEDSP